MPASAEAAVPKPLLRLSCPIITTLVVFVLARLLPFGATLLSLGPRVAPDSGTYRYGFWNWEVLFGMRGIGITGPFTLMPNHLAVALLQWLCVTGAGAWLILELARMKTVSKWIPIAATFATLCSPTVMAWDTWVLSHSLTLAYGLIALSTLVAFLRSGHWAWLMLMTGALVGTAVSRPSNMVVLAVMVTTVLVFALVGRPSSSRRSIATVGVVGAMALIVTYNYNSWLGSNWHPPNPAVLLPYILSEGIPVSEAMIAEAKLSPEIPECAFPDAPVDSSTFPAYLDLLANECPAGLAWISDNFERWYVEFYVSNPDVAMAQLNYGLAVALGSPADYGGGMGSVIPEPLAELFLASPTFTQSPGFAPALGWFILALVIVVLAGIPKFRAPRALPEGRRALTLAAALASSYMLALVVGILYQSHGDNFRVFIDIQVMLVLCSTTVVGYGLSPLSSHTS